MVRRPYSLILRERCLRLAPALFSVTRLREARYGQVPDSCDLGTRLA